MFKKYRIKKYYIKKHKPGQFKIWAKVYVTRFGFIMDIIDEPLDADLKCGFEIEDGSYIRQIAKKHKEVQLLLKHLNSKL